MCGGGWWVWGTLSLICSIRVIMFCCIVLGFVASACSVCVAGPLDQYQPFQQAPKVISKEETVFD